MSYDDETRTTGHLPSSYTPTPAYQVAPRPQPRNIARYAQWAIAAAALLAAALFLLLPLPTLNVLGTPMGFCGPGPTSDNAAQVLIDPSVVSGQGDLTDKNSVDSDSALRTYCLGKAKARGYYALAAGGGGLVVALGVAYAQASPRRRVGTW